MLSQLYTLTNELDGRYATDAELQACAGYAASYQLRQSAYQKLQMAEKRIFQQVQVRIRQMDPNAMPADNPELRSKCERDTLFVMRNSAIALLLNDTRFLEAEVLMWLQTIMRSFKDHQRYSDLTYRAMQAVVQEYLTPAEADLFYPILELNRKFLGMN